MVKQRKDAEALEKETEGNALIAKLRQQTEDNKEKNDSIVRRKTLENDQVSFFGRVPCWIM
jgi:ABC-type Fe3+-hydroxamate transport system substrate-binding protein